MYRPLVRAHELLNVNKSSSTVLELPKTQHNLSSVEIASINYKICGDGGLYSTQSFLPNIFNFTKVCNIC